MLQLIYMSRAAGDPSALDVSQLVGSSQIHNRAAEITGILIRRGPFFVHVMEGPRAAVEDTFLRIIADPRHHSLMVLSRRVVGWRDFGTYEMSDIVTNDDQENLLNKIDGYLQPGSFQAQERMSELRHVGLACFACKAQ